MDKIDERYKNGKIYTIRNRYDDNLIYVGSTIQKLCMRMGGHRRDKTCSLYQYVNGNWEDWYIELYEEYPCNNKSCLEKREGEVIRLIGNINCKIAGRTCKEYYEDNKEKILKQVKKYQEDNKDKIAEKAKEHYEDNKDKILEKAKEYRENNKEKIAEYLKEYNENNKEKLAKLKKEYQQNNKQKIAEKKKKYYENNKDKIFEKIRCDNCGSETSRTHLARHKKSSRCLNYNVGNN